MLRPWRKLSEPELTIHGEEGDGKVLVTIRRDRFNDPVEQVWCESDTATHWDSNRWKTRP